MAEISGSTKISREEYLKRYLTPNVDEGKKMKLKKKRKKLPSAKINGLQIIDVDIGMKDIEAPKERENVEEEDEAPLVAEVRDDRPQSVKVREQYSPSQWKRIAHDSDGDEHERDVDVSSVKRQRYDSDSDCSPPRQSNTLPSKSTGKSTVKKTSVDADISSVKRQRYDSDSDYSPPRQSSTFPSKSAGKSTVKKRSVEHALRDSDGDLSPIRPKRHGSDPPSPSSSASKKVSNFPSKHRQNNSDSDFSPPRRWGSPSNSPENERHRGKRIKQEVKQEETSSKTRRDRDNYRGSRSRKDMHQSQKHAHKQEIEKNEQENFEVVRIGKDTREADEEKRKEKLRLEAKEAQYSEWGKGLEQKEQWQNKIEADLYEMSKPLARYKDDDDLDRILKEQVHEGDPMLEYIQKKKKKSGKEPGDGLPKYSGPPAPPNRFGILPGYRWDGVDRSNGFEKKYFSSVSNSASKETESYLWSVQDM